jgi:hypothetical protein
MNCRIMKKDEFRERMLADRELRKAKRSLKDPHDPIIGYRKDMSTRYLHREHMRTKRGR